MTNRISLNYLEQAHKICTLSKVNEQFTYFHM